MSSFLSYAQRFLILFRFEDTHITGVRNDCFLGFSTIEVTQMVATLVNRLSRRSSAEELSKPHQMPKTDGRFDNTPNWVARVATPVTCNTLSSTGQ